MLISRPVLGGLEATRLIRKYEQESINTNRVKRTPICAVTGNARAEYLDAAIEAGMNDRLTKPYTRERISNVLMALTAEP
ncbi:hypothetical protein BCR37DRAFT_381523 [Protomyces lactucae-debilis]|uniref:Response regulatory domain-containing protein n=1 Tax=Protomyces lactucae-debilis TaxID=2754530 RepID=A0A1Y2F666_PROLT|nr:uncharacterized protein BCR37DRAFT_381523 [Protomyces lactucae-debilis]ORY79381.1 hypothetical protein BCR37DRAFT_381523 [Protomyces lactucae-debilis]